MKTLWLSLLLSSVIWAEEEYFLISPDATWNDTGLHQSNGTLNDTGLNQYNTTWDDARNHCQACYKELATITSRNVHLIVQNLSLDYWTGLRRSFNGTIPWSRWSNGDPVTYQNWYPGHPLPNKVKKMILKCPSTTQSPLSTLITATTPTPVTSTNSSTQTPTHTSTQTSTVTSPVNSPQISLTSETNNTDMCPTLDEFLQCLNMTYDDLQICTVNDCPLVNPKTTTYSTTSNPTTYSTTPNATTFSTIFTTTGSETENTTMNSTTTESTTASNCVFEPEPDPEVYIEDACVVLLSFGMWKEKNCNETLPFICYDDRFFGEINISNVTTSAGNVSWSNPPGNITHYRVEITNQKRKTSDETHLEITGNQTKQTYNETDLYKQLQDLTPGNLYKVQVFPVKCGRDLNPQNISFYTKPSGVQHLTVVSVTTVTVSLNWSKPEGDSDFYSVHVKNMSDNSTKNRKCESEECTITNLTPGNEYNFTVSAVVNETTEGVPMSVSNFSIPSVVLNLTSANNDSTVITANWTKPIGNHSGYMYCLYNSSDCTNCKSATNCKITNKNSIQERDKIDGTVYCLCVAALTNYNTLSGEMVVISAYTIPKTVNLSLNATSKTMTANWTIEGNFEKFNVTIETTYIDNYKPLTYTINTLSYTFEGLKAGVQFKVSVVTINGDLKSEAAIKSSYTEPTKPGWANAKSDKTTINVTWGVPEDSQGATINYTVTCDSAFWNDFHTNKTTSTNYAFPGLKSGTRYKCEVRVVTDSLISSPVTAYADTEPEKRTLILTMLCSSATPLHCEKNETMDEFFKKMNDTFTQKFHEDVHWRLKWVDRKEIVP
ncbi:receptor-type tyrosine-protein phosphatase H [Siphateles boraxobius]|uniref:receptor-type tyrosine-protein phosphatase H n=1 Tax=Siphateles boraxobius TaxID=180520 RepID=UPI004063BF40